MVKTLRITSVAAVFLAVVFFVLPAVFGFRGDAQIEEFLKLPGAIEEFSEARGQARGEGESHVLPLIKQAESFASYLNPPARQEPAKSEPIEKLSRVPRPSRAVSPKFRLIGTSYYALRPDMSLALVDEPGKGFRWVSQSSEVGRLVIEKIEDARVLVRDGQRTFEMLAARPEKGDLVKRAFLGGKAVRDEGGGMGVKGMILADEETAPPSGVLRRTDDALAEMEGDLRAQLESAQAAADLEEVERLERLISDVKAMRISDEEAENLGLLGRSLKAGRRIRKGKEERREAGAKMGEDGEPNVSESGAEQE
jgi:hypothetical protein